MSAVAVLEIPSIFARPVSSRSPSLASGTGKNLLCTPATDLIAQQGSEYRQTDCNHQESVGEIKNRKVERYLDEVNYVTVEKLWLLKCSINKIPHCTTKGHAANER